MTYETRIPISRRAFSRTCLAAAAGLAVPALLGRAARAQEADAIHSFVPDAQDPTRLLRRISGLSTRNWQDHFDSVSNDAILCDTRDRVLHYWGSDGFYRIYPTSVPLRDDLTRRGRTEITLKRLGPEWRPTDAMLERNPQLPGYVGPGRDNPLGSHALNLSWQYYRIHGTNDIRKIGRQSSNGCIGLFNEHIEEVFKRAQIGTPVLLI